jgi:hypothetical protein
MRKETGLKLGAGLLVAAIAALSIKATVLDRLPSARSVSAEPHLMAPSVPAPPRPEPETKPEPLPPGFRSAALDSPYPFEPFVGADPQRVCDALDKAGFANSGWTRAEIGGAWECMAALAEDDTAAPANSVFYMLRGSKSGHIGYGRMKINLLDPASEAKTLADAVRFMDVLSAAAGFGVPTDLLAAIQAKTPANIVTEQAHFRLKAEFNDTTRFNLSIELGPTLYAFYRTPEAGKDRVDAALEHLPRDKQGRVGRLD